MQYCSICFKRRPPWLSWPRTSHKYKPVKPTTIQSEIKFWSVHCFSGSYFKHIKSVTKWIFIQSYETAWNYWSWNGYFQQTPTQTTALCLTLLPHEPLLSPWQTTTSHICGMIYVICNIKYVCAQPPCSCHASLGFQQTPPMPSTY